MRLIRSLRWFAVPAAILFCTGCDAWDITSASLNLAGAIINAAT